MEVEVVAMGKFPVRQKNPCNAKPLKEQNEKPTVY